MSLQVYVIQSDLGLRIWYAEDVDHAIEQHRDAFPDEPILGVDIAVKASSEWPGVKLEGVSAS